jgi:hypothetical protein
MYRVERHGGRACDRWRSLGEFSTQKAAHELFVKLWPDVRQGGLRILAPDGTVIRQGAEPRLRTRW